MVEERRQGMGEILQRLTAAETHLLHGAKRMESMDCKIDGISTAVSAIRDELRCLCMSVKNHCEDSVTHIQTVGSNSQRIDALESWRDKIMGALKIVGSLGVLGATIELVRRYL